MTPTESLYRLRERAAIIIESNPTMTDEEVREELKKHREYEDWKKAKEREWTSNSTKT